MEKQNNNSDETSRRSIRVQSFQVAITFSFCLLSEIENERERSSRLLFKEKTRDRPTEKLSLYQ